MADTYWGGWEFCEKFTEHGKKFGELRRLIGDILRLGRPH